MILLRAAAATLLVACSDAAVDPGPKPTETNPQPPRAAFTMRDGSNVANDGAALSLSAPRDRGAADQRRGARRQFYRHFPQGDDEEVIALLRA